MTPNRKRAAILIGDSSSSETEEIIGSRRHRRRALPLSLSTPRPILNIRNLSETADIRSNADVDELVNEPTEQSDDEQVYHPEEEEESIISIGSEESETCNYLDDELDDEHVFLSGEHSFYDDDRNEHDDDDEDDNDDNDDNGNNHQNHNTSSNNGTNDSDNDRDARYARLLQQQEIALLQTQMFTDAMRGWENSEAAASFARLNPLARTMVARTMAMARHMQRLMRTGLGEEEEGDDEQIDMSYESLLELQENLGEVKRRGLEDHTLRALCRVQYTSTNDRHNNRELSPNRRIPTADGHQCVVCMTQFIKGETLVRLDCKHHFHETCAVEWLKMRATCPICRETVPDAPSMIDLR